LTSWACAAIIAVNSEVILLSPSDAKPKFISEGGTGELDIGGALYRIQ